MSMLVFQVSVFSVFQNISRTRGIFKTAGTGT